MEQKRQRKKTNKKHNLKKYKFNFNEFGNSFYEFILINDILKGVYSMWAIGSMFIFCDTKDGE